MKARPAMEGLLAIRGSLSWKGVFVDRVAAESLSLLAPGVAFGQRSGVYKVVGLAGDTGSQPCHWISRMWAVRIGCGRQSWCRYSWPLTIVVTTGHRRRCPSASPLAVALFLLVKENKKGCIHGISSSMYKKTRHSKPTKRPWAYQAL